MKQKSNHSSLFTLMVLALAIFGCTDTENSVEMVTGGDDTAMGGDNTAMGGSTEMPSSCERLSTDYPGSSWDECLVDDGTYRLAGESSPSSIARVAAFDMIADYLWRGSSVPSADDFLSARLEYELDEGLASRVTRRYDAHVERPENDVNCRGETDAADYPEFCVGPASMHPLITNAFVAGSTGEMPEVNAAKVEAGLLWFMYVSTHKEGYSCKDKAKDCDSAWAYYGAQETVDGAIGLARYVRDVSLEHHQDVFNAILAVRCWRGADNGETAIDGELHAQVLAQLDRALDRGIGQILMGRIERLRNESGAEAEASKAFLRVLGPTTNRAVLAFDAPLANEMAALWAGDLSESALDTLSNGIDEALGCPP